MDVNIIKKLIEEKNYIKIKEILSEMFSPITLHKIFLIIG